MLWPTEPRTPVCGVEQVLQLQYRVQWLSVDVSVRNDAAPVMVQLAGFSCSLSGETLIAEPSSDYFSVDAARAALEPAWHAWGSIKRAGPRPPILIQVHRVRCARGGVQPAARGRDQ